MEHAQMKTTPLETDEDIATIEGSE